MLSSRHGIIGRWMNRATTAALFVSTLHTSPLRPKAQAGSWRNTSGSAHTSGMARWRTVGTVMLVVVALAALGFTRAVTALTDGLCRNTPIQTAMSPDGTRQAILFARNCGATTGVSSQVSLLRADERLPNEPGNLFVADLDHFRATSAWGGPWIEVTWTDADAILLRYDRQARVVSARETLDGSRMTYEPVAPEPIPAKSSSAGSGAGAHSTTNRPGDGH